jgi:hypothetical protein
MTNQTRLPVYAFIGLISLSVMLAGCIIHVGARDAGSTFTYSIDDDYSTTNKSVKIPKGSAVQDVSSVNGAVTLADEVTAEELSNVNGSITIGNKVTVRGIETVNGKIQIGDNFSATESIETVNGKIAIGNHGKVSKNIETVNGNIELNKVIVGQDIETTNGSVYLMDESVVQGDVIFEGKPSKNNRNKRPPVLKVDASSTIQGKIIVYKEVEFDFASAELLNKVERR